MVQKYIYFSVFISVLFICILQVHISYCQKSKYDDDDDDSTEKSFTAPVEDGNGTDTKNIAKTLSQFLKVPPMPFITYGPYPFEGVDYDLLPKEVYKNYYDCSYLHTRCVRDRVYIHAVCAYSKKYGWVAFVNHCELELQNCRARMKEGLGLYGYSMRDDAYFYNGDGWNCKYSRRSTSQVSFYSDGADNRLITDIMNTTTSTSKSTSTSTSTNTSKIN